MFALQKVMPGVSILANTTFPKQRLSPVLNLALPIFAHTCALYPSLPISRNIFKLTHRSISSAHEFGNTHLIHNIIKYRNAPDRIERIRDLLPHESINFIDDSGKTALDYALKDPFLYDFLRQHGAKLSTELRQTEFERGKLNVRLKHENDGHYDLFKQTLSSAGK